MLVCKVWWVNCDKQHWEDEETGQKWKTSVGWRCPSYFCLKLYLHQFIIVMRVNFTFWDCGKNLWWHYSSTKSSAVISHGTICFSIFCEIEFSNILFLYFNPWFLIYDTIIKTKNLGSAGQQTMVIFHSFARIAIIWAMFSRSRSLVEGFIKQAQKRWFIMRICQSSDKDFIAKCPN